MRAAFSVILLSLAGLARADGNVLVFVDPEGDLVVLGDAQANALVISEKGDFLIRGIDTTINGGTGPFPVPPELAGFRIELGAGDDRIDFEDARLFRPSAIDMGSGDDVLFWTNGSSDACSIQLGAGDDVLDMDGCSFDALEVHGAGGADRVILWFGGVRGAFSLRGGGGDDFARIGNNFLEGRVSLHGNGGTDELVDEDNDYLGGPPRIRGFELVLEPFPPFVLDGRARLQRPGTRSAALSPPSARYVRAQ
jgi:hypothetical protein